MTTLAGFSVAAIELAWAKGNDAGDGFAWTAAERRGSTRLGTTGDSDADLTIWRRADGSMVGVGDAHGPWAVELALPGVPSAHREALLRAARAAGATEGDTPVVIVDTALALDPGATAAQIRETVRQATEDHAADCEHDRKIGGGS